MAVLFWSHGAPGYLVETCLAFAGALGAFLLFSHLAGDAIAPPLVGYLSDRFGLRPAMLLLPSVGLVGGLVILVALRTVARDMARVKA